ncbi:NAD-dependent epimerase/dehydratase family protein [Allochromatium humboldtianum]|uniref:NAD-dependent epimerase/dehydratase family protein n=1 Tax=Allochromatium humboldtianum TaxID=504901 RepID=A0A850RG84_9GAMM|nr:NAD-dependent epimerase/dehydratase family protein [Allochromatium humboldtianum]NVZ11206.1 NAD-dependent epimerase/dehydratase family protein [Allochromatium humboldtianum]
MKSHIAVTGATGFLGRHVIKCLLDAGIDAVATARTRSATVSGCRFVSLDIANPPLDAFERLGSPEVLIHLAWDGLPNYRSHHHFEQELPRQYRFLKGLIEAGLPKLVVAGTCFEYGLQSGELSEQAPTNPCTTYGFSKDALRRQLEYIMAETSTSLTWARLFYLWGEGQAPGSLYAQISAAANRGDARFPMSGGEQLRDYLPVSQAADLMVQLALQSGGAGVLNLCSGQPVSVRSLVEHWIVEYDWNIIPTFGCYPYPDYEPMAFWGSASRLINYLIQG